MDTTKYRAFSATLLWSLSLNAGVKESPSEGSMPVIIYKDGLLKVPVKNKYFKTVMDEVTLKNGVKTFINSPLNNETSVSFDYLPLEEGYRTWNIE